MVPLLRLYGASSSLNAATIYVLPHGGSVDKSVALAIYVELALNAIQRFDVRCATWP